MFNKKTGFFARMENKNETHPRYSAHGPELLDISLTNYCEEKCSICYKYKDNKILHMGIDEYRKILMMAKECDVLQIALGGGNPVSHPCFTKIIQETRETFGIVPSYTTNGNGLTDEILKKTETFCGAMALSLFNNRKKIEENLVRISKYKIKVNIHFVLTNESVNTAIELLKGKDDLLYKYNINAIIFLNYKPVGKLASQRLLFKHSSKLDLFFKAVQDNKTIKIGFDSCSISGLVKYLRIDDKYIEACEASRFSAYISENLKLYPCSFLESKINGYDLTKGTIKDAWLEDQDIIDFRNKILNNKCADCKYEKACLGGCPAFNEINLC